MTELGRVPDKMIGQAGLTIPPAVLARADELIQ
jgi:hypothetical protein